MLRFPSANRLMRLFLPDEAVTHIQATRGEQLLAFRAVLDAAIARIDRAEQAQAPSAARRTEIRIDGQDL